MGVAAVWDVTKPGFDERQPFSVLVTNFYKEHGRPIRIAIDAYQWLFEAGKAGQPLSFGASILAKSKLIQNFHSRIRELISLNVSFVLVFDGRFKPSFKRNADLQKSQSIELEGKDFDSEYLKFKELSERNGSSLYQLNDMPDVAELKEELQRWNITYVEAPGEGEAEASRLQSMGVVDYVLSNDSDTIIFGATKILRNFSKFEDDKPAGAMGSKPYDEFWCTPVDMETVKSKTGFDRWRVLLFSILTGADYNNGVKNIGSERAFQLALSATEFMNNHVATCPYETFPDFSLDLKEIFFAEHGLPEPETRRAKYQEFQFKMFEHVSENLVEYFGRNGKALVKHGYFENFPPDYVVMLYFHPLLRNDIFKFEEGTTNFAETRSPQKWIDLPKFDESLNMFKKSPQPHVLDIDVWYTRILSEAYLLKHIIHDIEAPVAIEKMKTKDIGSFDLDQFGIRFNYFFPFGEIEDPKKLHLKWIPKDLVPTSSRYYKEYQRREEAKRLEEEEKSKKTKKRSPRKKKATQASNLMTMGFIDAPSKEQTTSVIQRRRSVSIHKQSTNVLDMLKATQVLRPTAIQPSEPSTANKSPTKREPLFVEADLGSDFSDEEADSSPVKPVKTSPAKIETELKSTTEESPIRVKSRKQEHDTSPSKGSRSYILTDLENETNAFPSAKKKLDFTKIQSSTPNKKAPLTNFQTTREPEDITMITVSDVSMANDSSLMEISHISEDPTPPKTTISESSKKISKKYSALDEILKPIEYSSEDSD